MTIDATGYSINKKKLHNDYIFIVMARFNLLSSVQHISMCSFPKSTNAWMNKLFYGYIVWLNKMLMFPRQVAERGCAEREESPRKVGSRGIAPPWLAGSHRTALAPGPTLRSIPSLDELHFQILWETELNLHCFISLSRHTFCQHILCDVGLIDEWWFLKLRWMVL